MLNLEKSNVGKVLLNLDIPFRNYIFATLALNVFMVALSLLLRIFLPPQVPLYYGLAEGEGQLGSSWELIIPNLTALTITVVNLALSRFVSDDFLKKTLAISSIGVTLLATITIFKIIFLVGSF